MNRTTFFLGLFLIIAIGNLAGRFFDVNSLAVGCKILLMPSLFLYAQSIAPTNKKLFLALFFSWLGDLFLIPEGKLFFILGIAGFWGAQIHYILLLLEALKSPLKKQFSLQKLSTKASIYFLYLLLMLMLLLPLMGTLQLPVALYASTLCVVGYLSVQLYETKKEKTVRTLVLGILLFIISDSMIAFDAFYFDRPLFMGWVMATYIPAQFLIVNYFVKNSSTSSNAKFG